MADPLSTWYRDIPPVTRTYLTCVLLTTLACQLDLASPFHLYFNPDLIWKGRQHWRLLTSFLYFGGFSVDLLFHLFFLARYSRALEEGCFRGRTADFAWMLLLAATAIVGIVALLPQSVPLPFLSSPLTFHLVYLWSRRNPAVRMNMLGLFNFSAPYLPYVLVAFSLLLNSSWPTGDLVGIATGHGYYYLEDVWPNVNVRGEGRGARHVLGAPVWFKKILEIVGVREEVEVQEEVYLRARAGDGERVELNGAGDGERGVELNDPPAAEEEANAAREEEPESRDDELEMPTKGNGNEGSAARNRTGYTLGVGTGE